MDTLDEILKKEISESKQNKNYVTCKNCGSVVLSPLTAEYLQKPISMPKLNSKNTIPIEIEEILDFWSVKDIYTFENIGFLNDLDNKKYLICADCEQGPIGYQCTNSNYSYVAIERVKHKPTLE